MKNLGIESEMSAPELIEWQKNNPKGSREKIDLSTKQRGISLSIEKDSYRDTKDLRKTSTTQLNFSPQLLKNIQGK